MAKTPTISKRASATQSQLVETATASPAMIACRAGLDEAMAAFKAAMEGGADWKKAAEDCIERSRKVVADFETAKAVEDAASLEAARAAELGRLAQASAAVEAGSAVRILSRIDGFRRAGMTHPKGPVDHPAGTFTQKQIAQLLAEPNLSVELI